MPPEAGKTIEEAEFEKVANTEVDKGAEVGRDAVAFCGKMSRMTWQNVT